MSLLGVAAIIGAFAGLITAIAGAYVLIRTSKTVVRTEEQVAETHILVRQVDRAVNGKPPGASTMVAQVQHLHDQQFPPLDMDDDEAILPLLRKIDARLAILDDQER